MSIRKHRTEAAYQSHGHAEVFGGTAGTRGAWLARRTARLKARAEAEGGERGSATLPDDSVSSVPPAGAAGEREGE